MPSRVYDPVTQTWKQTSSSGTKGTSSTDGTKSTKKDTTPKTSGDNLGNTTSDPKSSTGKAEKKANYIELNTLEGTLNFIATPMTIKYIKPGCTIKLKGLGSYLSGNYYVKDVTRQISSNGYEHSATVIKTNFGDSLKEKKATTKGKDNKKTVTSNKTGEVKVSNPKTKDSNDKTYTVKAGDCLYNIAVKYYKDGSKYTKIYEANKDKISNPNSIKVGQVLIIP